MRTKLQSEIRKERYNAAALGAYNASVERETGDQEAKEYFDRKYKERIEVIKKNPETIINRIIEELTIERIFKDISVMENYVPKKTYTKNPYTPILNADKDYLLPLYKKALDRLRKDLGFEFVNSRNPLVKK